MSRDYGHRLALFLIAKNAREFTKGSWKQQDFYVATASRYSKYTLVLLIKHNPGDLMQKKTVPKKILKELISRIVEVADPDRIILFGSAARGEMGPHSDIDLLVIKKGAARSRDIASDIYMRLYGIGHAVDLIVVSPEQVEKYRDSPYLVINPALREGIVIYDAKKIAA